MFEKIKSSLIWLILGKWIKPIVDFLNEKKSILSLLCFILYALIYAVPQEYPAFAPYAEQIKYVLLYLFSEAGLQLPPWLLETALGLGVVGLGHKAYKSRKKELGE